MPDETNEKGMTREELDRIIEKGKKLLALADSDNPHEADNAMRRLGEMMAKYELTIAAFETTQQAKEELGRIDVDGLTKTRRYYVWESRLANAVGRSFNCRVILISRYVDQWRVAFLGRKKDLEMAVHFHEYLRGTINRRGKFFHKSNPTERSTYCMGMCSTITERLREMYEYKKQAMGSECTALVRTQSRVDEYTNEIFPRLTTIASPVPRGSRDAYMQGQQHGRDVPLSRPVSGGTRGRGEIE